MKEKIEMILIYAMGTSGVLVVMCIMMYDIKIMNLIGIASLSVFIISMLALMGIMVSDKS